MSLKNRLKQSVNTRFLGNGLAYADSTGFECLAIDIAHMT